MFTLHFLAGLGLGAFIATFILFALLIAVIGFQKRTSRKYDEHNDATLQMMKERNELDVRKAVAFESVAQSLRSIDQSQP